MAFQKGHAVSKKTRQAVSDRHLGIKHSEEWNNRIGKSLRRRKILGLKRKPYSKEYREKMRLRFTGKKQSPETIAKRFAWRDGYKHSEETKRKIGYANTKKIHKTDESVRARKSIKFKKWRNAVFARDNWTCQKYGTKGGALHPHHILNFAEHKELRYSVENGITLSKNAHKEFHKIYGQRNNTQAQILEFIDRKVLLRTTGRSI